MSTSITFGKIRDAGYTKKQVIAMMGISQPTFDKKLREGSWTSAELRVFQNIGIAKDAGQV